MKIKKKFKKKKQDFEINSYVQLVNNKIINFILHYWKNEWIIDQPSNIFTYDTNSVYAFIRKASTSENNKHRGNEYSLILDTENGSELTLYYIPI